MEYLVIAGQGARPFEEIETETIDALEQMGFSVQRTFSLRSATGAGAEAAVSCPGYSVLLFYAAGQEESMGLVTLYQHGPETAIRPVFNLHPEGGRAARPDPRDLEAIFVEFLMQGGLEVCVGSREGAICIDAKMTEDPAGSG